VLIDSWHFFRGGSTWEQLACIPLERIAYVQFDDAPAPAGDSAMKETMHCRVMPGDSTFELERFATTLPDRRPVLAIRTAGITPGTVMLR